MRMLNDEQLIGNLAALAALDEVGLEFERAGIPDEA
jgi:hypothetical protein